MSFAKASTADEGGNLDRRVKETSETYAPESFGPTSAAISENPFENEASRILFDAIDALHSCGAGEYVHIPKLVIVGGQSTGKSSLLQGLTEIPFPVGSDTCTRFATRIVSRRTSPGTSRQVKITIVPPDINTKKLADAFGTVDPNSYRDFLQVKESLTADGFRGIIEEATEHLKINAGNNKHNKNFALEMLKIEVSGPSQANFSILDIPGIFSNDLAVKPKEMEGVRQMAIEYMRQKESIVICVADAGTDLMMQEIFKLANDYVDPARLIGVFTKCDRLNASDASRIAQMTKGEGTGEARAPQSSAVGHNALPHGWFVVRNRTGDDSTAGGPSADLDSIEDELFSQPSWSGVRADRRGTSQLRQYLGNLLSEKIRLAFPKLLAKLDDLLSKSDTELANLGAARTTTHLRRVYLADIARQYELRARDALERPWHVDDSRARVRTLVRAHNDAFGIRMRIDGHAYQFEDHDVSDEEYWSRIEPILKPDISVAVQLPDTPPTSPPRPGRKEKASSRTRLSTAGGQAPIISTSYHTDALLKAISEEVRICGCTELPGFVHPDVIRRLYRMQTERWHDVANDHLRSVATAVQDASCEILSSVVPTVLGKDTLYEGLDQVIRRQYDQALATSLQRLQTYTDGDRSKLLQTTDPAFTRRLRLLQSVRLISTVNRSILKVKMETDNASVEELGAMMFQDAHHSSETNTVLEVHDALKVYYQFSLQAFIHHVTNTIVEDFVTDPDGPLLGFSAKFIYSLPDTDIDRLGGESHETVDQRRRLDDRIRTLREAQQTARVALERARGYGL